MHVHLDERTVADTVEAVHFAGLDHENVAGASFELLPVDVPETPPFSHELHLIIGMSVRSRAFSRKRAQQKHGNVHVAVIGSHEAVRATLEGKIRLANAVHGAFLSGQASG